MAGPKEAMRSADAPASGPALSTTSSSSMSISPEVQPQSVARSPPLQTPLGASSAEVRLPSTSSPPTEPVKRSRAGARQRRAANKAGSGQGTITAALPADPSQVQRNAAAAAAGLPWNEEERREALMLVREITSAGLAPAELVRQGIRTDVVQACCRQLGIPFEGAAQSSSGNGNVPNDKDPVRQGKGQSGGMTTQQATGKTKRRRRRPPPKDRFVRPQAGAAGQTEAENTAAGENGEMLDLLRKRIELERERAILVRIERQRQAHVDDDGSRSRSTDDRETAKAEARLDSPSAASATTDTQTTSSAALSSVEAMRQAALASMKRKRSSARMDESSSSDTQQVLSEPLKRAKLPLHRGTVGTEEQPPSSSSIHTAFSNPTLTESYESTAESGTAEAASGSGPPPDAPRGPRHYLLRYRDIDAPGEDVAQLEWDAGEAEQSSSNGHAAYPGQPDLSSNGRRFKPLSYVDDDYHYEVGAPAGQVDYTAPLPTLSISQPPTGGGQRGPPGMLSIAPRATRASAKRKEEYGRFASASSPSVTPHIAPFQPRRSPFLPNAQQRLVVEFSDGEESDGEGQSAAKQERNASTRSLVAAFKKEQHRRSHLSPSPGASKTSDGAAEVANTVNGSNAAGIDSRALLQSKEREIELLRQKMRMLQERKKVPVTGSRSPDTSRSQSPSAAGDAQPKAMDKDEEVSAGVKKGWTISRMLVLHGGAFGRRPILLPHTHRDFLPNLFRSMSRLLLAILDFDRFLSSRSDEERRGSCPIC